MYMDPEKRARRQSLRVIISETIMVLAVVVTVAVLALIVSGYWLNSDFKVERQGMLQIYSVPTGANVAVDGDSPWFQRTNTSKVLSSGQHEIVLTKDGYDSWSKTIEISEGLLYRLHYPRLFLLNREKEAVYSTDTISFVTASPSRRLLLIADNTTAWTLINLDSDSPRATTLDISKYFSTISLASGATTGLFTGEIISAEWDNSNEHILFEVAGSTGVEWVLINIKNPASSINLTREFAADFNQIKIFDNSANSLLAIRNGNLHRIDVGARQISAILVEDVRDFDFYDSEIIYVTSAGIKMFGIGDSEDIPLVPASIAAQVLIGKFYDDKYIFVIDGGDITVYRKNNLEEEIMTATLSFVPENAKVGYDGSFVIMNSGANFATLDMETMSMREWTTDTTHYGWVSSYMIYSVYEGRLFVYDFDGLNRRELATNVSERFPVVITSDKWLYYFSDGTLMREWLIGR